MNWRCARSYRYIGGSILINFRNPTSDGIYHNNIRTKRVVSRNFTRSHFRYNARQDEKPNCLVIGGLAMDITMRFENTSGSPIDKFLFTSNPAISSTNIGGVAHNICQAAHYYGQCTPRLVSRVGYDFNFEILAKTIPDLSGIQKDDIIPTSKYIGFNDQNGDLIIAAADMSIIQGITSQYAIEQIDRVRDSLNWICIDGNISPDTARAILDKARLINCPILFEPTSVPRARAMASVLSTMSCNACLITAMTPNIYELDAIYQELDTQNKLLKRDFTRYIIGQNFANDGLKTSEIFDFDLLIHKLGCLVSYIPNIFLKLGKYGVLYATQDYSAFHHDNHHHDTRENELVVNLHYFPSLSLDKIKSLTRKDKEIDQGIVQNVSGAGDSFTGCLLAELCHIRNETSSPPIDNNNALSKIINTAQAAACLTLFSNHTVSNHIVYLKSLQQEI